MPSRLTPPGPRTEYSHPSCYLRATTDCSEELSREHYISRDVLEVLGESSINISGVPWLEEGERKNLGLNALTAKVLCKRHNENLSPLDAMAGRFFRAILGDESVLFGPRRVALFSGDDLERWILKVLFGAVSSVNAVASYAERNQQLIMPAESTDLLLDRREWPSGVGLGILVEVGQSMFSRPLDVNFAPLFRRPDFLVQGATVKLAGLELAIRLTTVPGEHDVFRSALWKPRQFDVIGEKRTIVFGWQSARPEWARHHGQRGSAG